MRKTAAELEEIKKKYGVDTIWSWSRLEKARQSKNEFYLTYVKHVSEDRNDCVYGTLGGLCHDSLEKLYEGQIQYEDMIEYFDENWMATIDVMGLKFDRNDSDKNKSIAFKYKENLEHFFTHHEVIPHKVVCEQFILTNFDGIIFQGYADAIFKDDDRCYNIIDFKTSTKYTASTMKEKCGQLVCYALGLNQLGASLDKIKIAWNFLKYVNVKYEQANGKIASKDIERRDIGTKLQAPITMWLKKFGYVNQIDDYIQKVLSENSLDSLPDEVKAKFEIRDCYVYIDLTQSLIDYWRGIVKETVSDIEERIKSYDVMKYTNPEQAWKVFEDPIEDVEKESYYYATLSGYSANLNQSYKQYLEYLDSKKNGDIFSGVGSEADDFIDALVNEIALTNHLDEWRKNHDGDNENLDDTADSSNDSVVGDEPNQEELSDEASNEVSDEDLDMSWLNEIM